jgi:hypothetical protein
MLQIHWPELDQEDSILFEELIERLETLEIQLS